MSNYSGMPALMAATEYLPKKLKVMKKERKLPKSWEEFCAYYPVPLAFSLKQDQCASVTLTQIDLIFALSEFTKDRKIAEALLALLKLILLRDCYNDNWKPDWKNTDEIKYTIQFDAEEIRCYTFVGMTTSFLYFKSKKLRYMFLCNFRSLIEKLKPLYSIIK